MVAGRDLDASSLAEEVDAVSVALKRVQQSHGIDALWRFIFAQAHERKGKWGSEQSEQIQRKGRSDGAIES